MIDVFDHETRVLPQPLPSQLGPQPDLRNVSRKAATPKSRPAPQPQSHLAAVVVLLPLRLFLAAGWLRAATEKLIDPEWWNGHKLQKFVTTQHDEALPFFRPVMDHLIAPGAQTVAIVVALTQLGCGIAIGIGKPLRLALRWAVLLNVVFVMAGKVNPSAFYLVMEIVLLFAVADGTIGVRPTSPSRKTVGFAAISTALALAVVPYIRTIEPAKVIEDPAMMLVFLGMIVAITLMVRRSAHRPDHVTYPRRLWTTWVAGWMHAKPKKVVRREYEWRYLLRGATFAPPQRGTATALVPPADEQSPIPTYPYADR